MNHTPGPWVASEMRVFRGDIDGNTYIAGTAPADYSGGDTSEAKANARLIAAAPDLLAALEAVIANGHESAPGLGAYLNARAAIAKAK